MLHWHSCSYAARADVLLLRLPQDTESDSLCILLQATLQKPAPLTVRGVFKTMKQIASEKGNGSALRKQRAVLGLLRSAR